MDFINSLNRGTRIQYEFSNQLEKYNELTLINDGKMMIQCNVKPTNQMIGRFTTEEPSIFVQEIVFEKYWDEVMSLKIATRD